MMSDAAAGQFQRTNPLISEAAPVDAASQNSVAAAENISAGSRSRTATPPVSETQNQKQYDLLNEGQGSSGNALVSTPTTVSFAMLPPSSSTTVGAAGTPLPPRLQNNIYLQQATANVAHSNTLNSRSELSQYGSGATSRGHLVDTYGPLSPIDSDPNAKFGRPSISEAGGQRYGGNEKDRDLDAARYRDPNLTNTTDQRMHFMERNPYYQSHNAHHSGDACFSSNISPRGAAQGGAVADSTLLGADPTATIPIFSPYQNRSALTDTRSIHATSSTMAGYDHNSFVYNMPSAAGNTIKAVSPPSPTHRGGDDANPFPIANRLQQQSLEGQSIAQRYAASNAANAVYQQQRDEAQRRNGASAPYTQTHQSNVAASLLAPSLQQRQQRSFATDDPSMDDERLYAQYQQQQQELRQLRGDGSTSNHQAPNNYRSQYTNNNSNNNNYIGINSSSAVVGPSSSMARYPITTPNMIDYSTNNLVGLRGDGSTGRINNDSFSNNNGDFTSHLAPPPEALHAAALSLRRQEEQLNAKELQLKMKEEELAKREFAIRQIILEALDVQGIAMVGGSVAAPNVAQALSGLSRISADNTSGDAEAVGGAGAASGGGNALTSVITNKKEGGASLFHSPTGVLEEQMIHFRDEFRRQRTQLRQLYEELNVRERELEAAAIGVKKFEQKLKMREMELDTRERALIAEEDDIVHDAKRHAAAITMGSDTMRKKLVMLEEHERSLETLMRDLEDREEALKRREEASKEKILAAKEAEDRIVKTLATAHDLEMRAKEVAIASDRLRIREESLWSTVSEIADESSAREAKAMDEVMRVKEELMYMRRALDERAANSRGGPTEAAGDTIAAPRVTSLVPKEVPNAEERPMMRSANNIRVELERIQAEIRAASAANQGLSMQSRH